MTMSQNIITATTPRRIRSAGHVVCIGKMRKARKIFIVKPERKKPLGRPRRKWYNGRPIKIYLKDIKCEDVAWIQLARKSTVTGSCEY
jgi:hypothetical protein